MMPKAQLINGLSKTDIQSVINTIKNELGIISQPQIRQVLKHVERVDRQWMDTNGKLAVLDGLSADLIKLFKYPKPPRELNMHQLQVEGLYINSEDTSVWSGSHIRDDGDPITREEEKVPNLPTSRIIDVQNIFGLNSAYNIRHMFNPAANLSDVYLNIDTKYRILDNDNSSSLGVFKFNILLDHVENQGVINVLGYIRDIVQMEIAPFRIPKTSNNAVTNEIIQYERATLRMHEFDSQAVIGHEQRYYHFEFVIVDKGNRFYDLVPLPNTAARFRFRKPITSLSSLSLSFGTPFQPLLFDRDRIVFTITNPAAGLLRFTTGGENHNLQVGDLVYMEKFNTDNVNSDIILIQSMNRSRGNKIEPPTATTFDIDIAALGLNDPVGNIIPANGIELFLGSKRIIFKIRLTYVSPLNENED